MREGEKGRERERKKKQDKNVRNRERGCVWARKRITETEKKEREK